MSPPDVPLPSESSSASTPGYCVDEEPLAAAAHALLDLVVVEDPAVLLAEVVQALRPLRRRDLDAVLALDQLDVDAGDAVRCRLVLEDHLLDVVETGDVAGGVVEVVRAAVAGGEGDVDPAAHERLDAVIVVGVVRAHGAGAVVAAVEAAQEGDDEGPAGPGGLAHDAHGVLHHLAARGVVDDLGQRLRGDLDQLLGELVVVPDAHRREALGAVLLEGQVGGLDELGVVAPEGCRGPAREPVDVAVAVDVLEEPAVAVARDEVVRRPAADERHAEEDVFAALHQRGAAGTGGRGVDVGARLIAHGYLLLRTARRRPATTRSCP